MVLRASRASANKINSGICAKRIQRALAANFITALNFIAAAKFYRTYKICAERILRNLALKFYPKLALLGL